MKSMPVNIPETYGEILPEGINKLIQAVSFKDNDVFLDLGSGLGKVVTQIFLQTPVKEARGIEINSQLHAQAESASAAVIENDSSISLRKITFIQGDFLKMSFCDASIVLIASPCFGPKMLHALGHKINLTPSIRTVLSLRPIATLARVTFKKVLRVECSWDAALCYVYE